MGLVVTLKIAEIDENRMFLIRSRLPKGMGGMLLGISVFFFIMYKAANFYLGLLHNSTSIFDQVLYYAIVASFIISPLLGLFLVFFDKRILVDKKAGEVRFFYRFAYIPLWRTKILFDQIDDIVVENICKTNTVAMMKAREMGKPVRAGHWRMSLRGKELGKKYFDRHPKKEEILSYAKNLAAFASKKIILVEN